MAATESRTRRYPGPAVLDGVRVDSRLDSQSDICKLILTMAPEAQHGADPEHLLDVLAALDSPHRIRLIALLARKRSYISELAREVGLSRPLLYLHLGKLQAAGLVRGSLELSDSGQAKKWFELVPFEIWLTPELVIAAADHLAAAHDPHSSHGGQRNETGGEKT